MSGTAPEPAPRTCANCRTTLTARYCAACGQKDADLNPTLAGVLREAIHELFEWDGKIPSTLKALLLQPGLLTEDWLAGRRARWLAPLRIYLTCSVAFFVSGPIVERITGRAAREVARLTITDDATPDGIAARAQAVQALRQYVDSAQAEAVIDNIGTLNDRFIADFPKAMFLLMPLFALITWATWRGGDLRYPAHLYFSLHIHAAFFASMTVSTVAGLVQSSTVDVTVGLAALAYTTWYAVAACKRVLGGTAGQVAVRSVIVGVIYGAAFTATMLALFALTILSL